MSTSSDRKLVQLIREELKEAESHVKDGLFVYCIGEAREYARNIEDMSLRDKMIKEVRQADRDMSQIFHAHL